MSALNPRFQWRENARTERERDLEDYISSGVRRVYATTAILGDGTAHASASYALVAPAVQLTYPKMLRRTKLVCHAVVVGEFGGAGTYVEMAIRATTGDGTVETPVRFCRFPVVAGAIQTWAGACTVALDGAAGLVTLDLMVLCAGGASWTSLATGTMGFSAVESL